MDTECWVDAKQLRDRTDHHFFFFFFLGLLQGKKESVLGQRSHTVHSTESTTIALIWPWPLSPIIGSVAVTKGRMWVLIFIACWKSGLRVPGGGSGGVGE